MCALRSGLLTLLEPVLARCENQLARALRREIRNLRQLVDRLLGEVLAGHDAVPRELGGEILVHTLDFEQVHGGLGGLDALLRCDRLREQHVARAVAQLLHHLRIELLDRREFRLRHVGNFLDTREARLHQDARHVLVHVERLHEKCPQFALLGLALLVRRLLAHDVELPARKLAGQSDVLPAAADCLREFVLGDRDVHAVRFLVDDDRAHLGGRHRVDDELSRGRVPRDDVDALAGDLARHCLHARATHADAGADRIDARVVALYRDLGAGARVARRTEDVDQALAYFRHLELEQLDQKVRCRARQEELRTARLGAHLLEKRLDAVLRAHRLARDHLFARYEAFGIAAEVHVDSIAVHALYDARYELADAASIGLDDLRALGLAHLLHDHLLGCLSGDAAEHDRGMRHFDVATWLGVAREIERVLQAQFLLGKFEFGGVVGKHLPAPEGVVVAGLAIDRDADVDVLSVLLARGGRERGFERLEDDLLVDTLLVRHVLDDRQDLFVHPLPSRSPGIFSAAPGAPCVCPRSAAPAAVHPPRPPPSRRQSRATAPCTDAVHRAAGRAPRRRSRPRTLQTVPRCGASARAPATTPRACSDPAPGRSRRGLRLPRGSLARSRRA